jgi:membrane protein DedA with SNARE-associated domain
VLANNPGDLSRHRDILRGMRAALTSRFRWWKLLAFSALGAATWSLYIAYLSRFPPNQEMLGDAAYRLAWTQIIAAGAAVGAIGYLVVWWRGRKHLSVTHS